MKNEKATEPVIAVIDDDNSVRQSLARLLKASGFQSVLFGSAEAFLADKQHPGFDCLLVDLQLGGISGTELQDRLISAGVNMPMILITARDEKELDRLALQAQGIALLRKSDPGEALLATLRRVMHRYGHQEKGRRNGSNA
jgi:FixJ family two-component response regulator